MFLIVLLLLNNNNLVSAFEIPTRKRILNIPSSDSSCNYHHLLFHHKQQLPSWRLWLLSTTTTSRSNYHSPVELFAKKEQLQQEEESQEKQEQERRLGLLVLCTVPLAWGTFEPAVRFVYEIQPPIPGLLFSIAYYLVAAITLSTLALLSSSSNSSGSGSSVIKEVIADDDKIIAATTSAVIKEDENKNKSSSSFSTFLQLPLSIQGGMELGFYLFLGNALQVFGLKTVPSDRAAFLLQLTTIFVPLVSAIIARSLFAITTRTWIACLIALAGVAVMGLDGSSTGTSDVVLGSIGQQDQLTSSSLLTLPPLSLLIGEGDWFIISAAMAYTFHCIRLEKYAKQTKAVYLASYKAITETVLCTMFAGSVAIYYLYYSSSQQQQGVVIEEGGVAVNVVNNFASETGQEIVSFLQSIITYDNTATTSATTAILSSSSLVYAIIAVLWTGWITVAYTIYAQSFGQSRVKATVANLIYTLQPVCTALVAFILLGETLGPEGYIGGSLIGAAVLMIATTPTSEVVTATTPPASAQGKRRRSSSSKQ